MCRIFYSPAEDLLFKNKDLWEFFAHLETLLGKDGNGVYTFKDQKLTKSTTKMPFDTKIDGALLFHTRYATHGRVADYNCQPFESSKYIMCHNGSFTEVELYANTHGFFNIPKNKYSDTYMINYLLEKIGIYNFYLTFVDKYYGVILVYDKKAKIMYLLKTGGSFTCGTIRKRYIYGSTALDYWNIDNDKTEDFDDGMYIIRKDGFQQLHKPKKKYTYSSYSYGKNIRSYSGYNNALEDYYDGAITTTKSKSVRGWEYNSGKKKKRKKKRKKPYPKYCEYCQEIFKYNDRRYDDYGLIICEDCLILYGTDDAYEQYMYKQAKGWAENIKEDYVMGINSLFGLDTEKYSKKVPNSCIGCIFLDEEQEMCEIGNPYDFDYKAGSDILNECHSSHKDSIPKRLAVPIPCHGCNWLKNRKCWWNGNLQDTFNYWTDPKSGLAICNTKYQKEANYDVAPSDNKCKVCDKYIPSDETWFLYRGRSFCDKCFKLVVKIEKRQREIMEQIPKNSMLKCDGCGIRFEEDELIYKDERDNILCGECNDWDEGFEVLNTERFNTRN